MQVYDGRVLGIRKLGHFLNGITVRWRDFTVYITYLMSFTQA